MPRRARRSTRSRGGLSYGLLALVVGFAAFLFVAQQVTWHPYLSWLVAWSATAFVVYGLDKSQAVRSAWRVSETTLHVLAIIGGGVGCWAGMLFFRHKTLHAEFKLTLVVAAVIHGALALAWLR